MCLNQCQDEKMLLKVLTVLGVLTALAVTVLTLANLILGPLNQDEGWYLLAARMVAGGAWPYRDFAFTQGPVMPFLYAPLTPLVQRGGLLAARSATAALGWLTILTAAALAGRWVAPSYRRAAWCLTAMLLGINVYHSYFTTIVKTYAAAGFLLTAGFFLLSFRRDNPSRKMLVGAAAAMVLAAGSRLSLAVVAPVMLIGLWRVRNVWPRAWLWFGAAAFTSALIVFVPLALAAPDGFRFGLLEYHAGRSPGDSFIAMALKMGFFSRMAQGYLAATILGVGLVAHRLCYGPTNAGQEGTQSVLRRSAAWSLVLVTIVHAASPFPYDDYQVVVYPPVCALLTVAIVRRIACHGGAYARNMRWAALFLWGAVAVAALAAPINQDWFVSGRDRIWWRFKERPDLLVLRETARSVRSLYDQPGGELLTQDPYLAVEAGCQVPAGLIMGPFAYFPDMPTERARRLHVMNRELMMALLSESQAPVAAFSGYGLAIAAPQITPLTSAESRQLWQLVLDRYELYDTVEQFGQAHTTLRILRRRKNPDSLQ